MSDSASRGTERQWGWVSDLREPPDQRALQKMCRQAFSDAQVVATSLLSGGIRCATHAVDLAGPAGEVRIALRLYPRFSIDGELHDVAHEWKVLTLLAGSDVQAPQPLWMDSTGDIFGVPAMAQSFLPGRLLSTFEPGDPGAVAQWAECTAAVHRTRLPMRGPGALPAWSPQRETSLLDRAEERAQRCGRLTHYSDILRLLRTRWPPKSENTPVLVHGDLHPSNILWHDGRISGVIDWAAASIGPPEVDVAHARFEIALRADVPAADLFLALYERMSGTPLPDIPLWDLMFAWRVAPYLGAWVGWLAEEGHPGLTEEGLREQQDALVRTVLSRLTDG